MISYEFDHRTLLITLLLHPNGSEISPIKGVLRQIKACSALNEIAVYFLLASQHEFVPKCLSKIWQVPRRPHTEGIQRWFFGASLPTMFLVEVLPIYAEGFNTKQPMSSENLAINSTNACKWFTRHNCKSHTQYSQLGISKPERA